MTIQLVGSALVAVALGAGIPAQEIEQKTSGVYVTATDYQNRRLTDEGDCTSASHKIELHDLLGKSFIHVTHESERRQYAKSALFGVRACDGRDYRFMANREYRILEARDLYIYVRREVQAVTGPRGLFRPIDTYYFSAGASGEVVPLTVENLKRAFPDNHRFHDSLDLMRGDLAQYDRRVSQDVQGQPAPDRLEVYAVSAFSRTFPERACEGANPSNRVLTARRR